MRPLKIVGLIAVLWISGCRSFRQDATALEQYRRDLDGGQTNDSVRQASFEEEIDDPSTSLSEAGDQSEKGFGLDDLAPERIGQTIKKAAGQGPNRAAANAKFEEAEALYAEAVAGYDKEATRADAKKVFAQAGDAYLAAAKRYPSSSLEHDALFQAGEAYFFADAYAKSNETFEKLIDKYPGTRYLDRVESRRFSIARFWLNLDEYAPDSFLTYNLTNQQRPTRDTDGHAMRILNKIRLDDPTGKLADDATMALGNAYFTEGRYLDAADTYEDLRKAYPGSTHLFNANLLEIRSRLEAYRGPDYDGTGLEKAERLLKGIVKQFPGKVEENRSYLDELAGEIRFRLAEREITLARLYDRREEYRAARLHYQRIATEFSDTSLADEASRRLDEIAEKPDLPPQRLKFLIDLLPEPKDQKPLFNNDLPR